MLTIIIGPAGAGKTQRINEEIRTAAASRRGGQILIVPEQYSHEAERELCRICGDSLSLYAEVLSFTGLARKVASLFGGVGAEYLDKGGRLLCMALAAGNCQGLLPSFPRAASSPELQNSLLSAMDEVKSSGIRPELLRQVSENLSGDLGQKLRDLSLLFEAYDAIVQNGHADSGDRLTTLAVQMEAGGYGRGLTVYVDGFTDFTAQEADILRCFLKNGAEVTVALTLDALEGGEEKFALPRLSAFRLLEDAKRLGTEWRILECPSARQASAGSCVHCLSPAEECEYAALRCLRLVRETGCRYGDIAIAVRGFDDYRALLEDSFEKYRIPLFTARKSPVSAMPLPSLISCAYDIILGGWKSSDIISFIGTGLTPFSGNAADAFTKTLSLRRIRESEKPDYLKRFERASAKGKAGADHAVALTELLRDMEVASRLEEKSAKNAQYAQLWDLTVSALEQIHSVLGNIPMNAGEFSRLFQLMLSKYDTGTIPLGLDRVCAGDFDRMRRRNISHLIVLGCSEGRLPCRESKTGIFSEADREQMADLGLTPGGNPNAELWREQMLIYNVFSLPHETICQVWSGVPSDVLEKSSIEGALEFSSGAALAARKVALQAENPEAFALLTQRAAAGRGRLSPAGVQAAYGSRISTSASRADKYYSCRYAFFCKFGLQAEKWEPEQFSNTDFGNFVHYVLEHVLKDGGTPEQWIEAFVHDSLQDFEGKSQRYIYLFHRLESEVISIVNDTLAELESSDFRPEHFELNLSGKGRADRIDSWEQDGKRYLRVVDYKSGTKTFNLSDVYYGINMQMLMYLDQLCLEDENAVPAGVMYVPARDRFISDKDRLSEETLQSKREAELRRSGLVLDDPAVENAWEHGDEKSRKYIPKKLRASREQMAALCRCVERRLSDMEAGLREGSIEANPYLRKSNQDSCTCCEFRDICGFTNGQNGEMLRALPDLKEEELWNLLEKEEQSHD